MLDSPGAGDLSPEDDEIGTRGGMSLGAGARNEPDFPLSLLGEALSFLSDDLPSSVLGELGLLSPLFELVLLLSFESLEAFSRGGMIDFDGVESLPMLLHVCASRASGLFLASNYKRNKWLETSVHFFSFKPQADQFKQFYCNCLYELVSF